MLEFLIISLCISGTNESCVKSAEAYYYQTNTNKIIDEYSKEHEEVASVVAVMGALKAGKATVPLYKKDFSINCNVGSSSAELVFNRNF